MEIWLRWGGTSVSFEAPEELLIRELKHETIPQSHYQALLGEALSGLGDPTVVIDYHPPASGLGPILELLREKTGRVYVSLWRVPPAMRGAELEALMGLGVEAVPLSELAQDTREVLLICHHTTRPLLWGFSDQPADLFVQLARMEGLDAPKAARVSILETGYDSEGTPTETSPARPPYAPDSVVVSAGGSPYDSTLYTALQALILASKACRDGGTVLLAAECAEGLGSPRLALALYESMGGSADGSEPWPELVLARRFREVVGSRRVYLATSLPRSVTQSLLGVKSLDTLQEGFSQLLRIHSREHRSALIAEGLHTYALLPETQ